MNRDQPSNRVSAQLPLRDVRMRGFQDRAEVGDVIELLNRRLQPVEATEAIDLHHAAGRVLAQDVIANVAVPAFDRAAMDGYALRGADTFGGGPYNPLELEVVGAALPGKPFAGTVQPGQAVRIMTGAPLPAGTDAVLMAEAAEETAGRVRVTDAVPPDRHVGRRGEDVLPGTVVLHAGRILRPQDVGVLASIGASPVRVVCAPTVAILVTGDELLPCGSKPDGCHIVDSNSVMLEALIRRDGGTPQAPVYINDQRDAVREALLNVQADIVLVSGGSSVGQEDHAPRVLAEVGELCIHGVALRPASPTGLGFLVGRPIFLLPGNPVSCLCAYDLFVGRVVRLLGRRNPELPYRTESIPVGRKISSAVGRVDYVRVQMVDGKVEPIAVSGASILSTATRAAGFVLVPRDSEGYGPGETVQVNLYD